MLEFRSGPKIIYIEGDGDGIEFARRLQNGFGDTAKVYRARLDGDRVFLSLMEAGANHGEEVLENPLIGPLVVCRNVPAQNDDPLNAIWTDSGLEVPETVIVDEEAGLDTVWRALLRVHEAMMRSAARRNVDMLAQIAVLRRQVEDLTVLSQTLFTVTAMDSAGAHRLLYEATAYGADRMLRPGSTARQRLPVTILPSLIGAVSLDVSAVAHSELQFDLVVTEKEEVSAAQTVAISPGETTLFVRVDNLIDPNARLVDIRIQNTGGSPVILKSAQQESPEEQLFISDEGEGTDRVGSLNLAVWSHGPNPLLQASAEKPRLALRPHKSWREDASPLTPGFEERGWLAKRGNDGLLVHPLPAGAIAVAVCPVQGGLAFNGLTLRASLPSKAKGAVDVRLIATGAPLGLESREEVNAFAMGDATQGAPAKQLANVIYQRHASTGEPFEGELARGAWTMVMPGTERPLGISWEIPVKSVYLHVATFSGDRSTGNAHLVVSDLQLVKPV